MKTRNLLQIVCLAVLPFSLNAQSWQLWASGLPGGTYPKLAIAPNHDIFYTLVATPSALGVVHKANAANATGIFTALPAVPLPASHVNNIQDIICNDNSEPLVGIFRNNTAEPFMFVYNSQSNTWTASTVQHPPVLGAFCFAKSPVDGNIYMGAKWSYVYKSTDGGMNFDQIDETALLGMAYPCYYPVWSGNSSDGAIYSINVDRNGRLYAGTEGAGILYSDDEGDSWHPADYFACQTAHPDWKDSASVMKPLSYTGNVGGIGFTANNNLVWNGTNMWGFGWEQQLGYADMVNHTTQQVSGFYQYLVTGGLQVSKIVTTANGQMFLHSGGNNNVPQTNIGIYTSMDGINWTQFNTGITGANDGQSQGSLAVDGNKVFMATHDGKVFMYDASNAAAVEENSLTGNNIYPNPAEDKVHVELNGMASLEYTLTDQLGKTVGSGTLAPGAEEIDVSHLQTGAYFLLTGKGQRLKLLKK